MPITRGSLALDFFLRFGLYLHGRLNDRPQARCTSGPVQLASAGSVAMPLRLCSLGLDVSPSIPARWSEAQFSPPFQAIRNEQMNDQFQNLCVLFS